MVNVRLQSSHSLETPVDPDELDTEIGVFTVYEDDLDPKTEDERLRQIYLVYHEAHVNALNLLRNADQLFDSGVFSTIFYQELKGNVAELERLYKEKKADLRKFRERNK